MFRNLDEIEILKDLSAENWALEAINVKSAWTKSRGKGVKIAVIDTGVDRQHPDLKDAIKTTINMHTRQIDVSDFSGHGTCVAGLIAGRYTGVAPESELYIAKVLDKDGYGTFTQVLDGITFAINLKVDILCMSLGTQDRLPLIVTDRLNKAYEAGIIIISASGNSNTNLEYPASLDNVIAVGGVDEDLKKSQFSNYGKNLDIVAPATKVMSTFINGEYAKVSGTSMATPLVAGSIALMKSYYREHGIELSLSDIREKFAALGEEKNYGYGYGVLDLEKLLTNL